MESPSIRTFPGQSGSSMAYSKAGKEQSDKGTLETEI